MGKEIITCGDTGIEEREVYRHNFFERCGQQWNINI